MSNRVKTIASFVIMGALTLLPAFVFSGASSQSLQAVIASFGLLAPVAYIVLFAYL